MSFVPSQPGCHTALHPPWIPASARQAAASDPAACCRSGSAWRGCCSLIQLYTGVQEPWEPGSPQGSCVIARPCCGSTSLSWFLCCYSSAVLGYYQLLPLPAVSRGGLAVASSTVGTALPIPTPNHGAAGCFGKHLARAACVSHPELLTVSTL